MQEHMQAVIMAGGKGTRLVDITKGEIPKPMVDIDKKPLLERQIEQLKLYDIDEITIVIGYLGEKISSYFKDGNDFGVKINYIEEKEPLGTAGAFYYLKEHIKTDDFMLIFGDVFFDIDIDRMKKFHKDKSALATLFVHPNSHPYDSDLIEHDDDFKVLGFDSKNNKRNYWYDNCVNAGIYMLNKNILDEVELPIKTDFEKDILARLVKDKKNIYAYVSPEYVKDIGTVDRIKQAKEDLEKGILSSKNLKNKQKAIFIDRDGTLNKLNGFISRQEDLELEDKAIEAIRLINESGRLAIVITNQPVVARGLCEIKDLDNLHNKIKTLLGNEGVFLDAIYYCPHHPDSGFPEENKAYKIKCECRKPGTDLIKRAVDRFNIDLENSWIIGDTTTDLETAKRAGVKSALVLTGEAGRDKKFEAEPDLTGKDIYDAVEKILKMEI